MVLFSFKRSVFKHTHRDLVERSGAVTVNCQVKHQSGFWWFRAPDTFVTTFSPFIWHTDTLLGLYFCCFSCCCSVYLYLWWCCCFFFFLKTLIDPIYVITGSLNWSWSFREMKSVIQHSDLFYSILFYSILSYPAYSIPLKCNVSWFSALILYAPWSPGYNLQVLARAPRRPGKTLREWHADRCAPLPPPPLPLWAAPAPRWLTQSRPLSQSPRALPYLHKAAARHWPGASYCKPPRVPLQMSSPRRRKRSALKIDVNVWVFCFNAKGGEVMIMH